MTLSRALRPRPGRPQGSPLPYTGRRGVKLMNMLRLSILPVYSEYHRPSYHIGSTQLLKHQVATWEAIRDPEIDVVFNTAMTGDGKSLAAYLPAFKDERKSIIAMYPTNELIQDQHS